MMRNTIKRTFAPPARHLLAGGLALSLGLLATAPAAEAKKTPPAADAPAATAAKPATPADNQAIVQAQLNATTMLAQIKVGRAALAEDSGIDDGSRSALGSLYDRQEATINANLDKLKSAKGDAATIAKAADAIKASGTDADGYLSSNATVKSKLTRRSTIINAELKDLTTTPDTFVANVAKVGASGSALSQAKTLANTAYQNRDAGDPSASSSPVNCRKQILALLTATQKAALDDVYDGAGSSAGAAGDSPEATPRKHKRGS